MIEEWKDVIGYEGLYQVSNYGRVKSLGRYVNSGHPGSKPRFKPEKILTTKYHPEGYIQNEFYKDGKKILRKVHRLVAIAFLGNHEDMVVNHIDGNKSNHRLDNLEWCTTSENHLHAYSTGLKVSKKGEKHHRSKLTDEQALNIKQLKGKLSQRKIAIMYGVSQTVVTRIHSKGGYLS